MRDEGKPGAATARLRRHEREKVYDGARRAAARRQVLRYHAAITHHAIEKIEKYFSSHRWPRASELFGVHSRATHMAYAAAFLTARDKAEPAAVTADKKRRDSHERRRRRQLAVPKRSYRMKFFFMSHVACAPRQLNTYQPSSHLLISQLWSKRTARARRMSPPAAIPRRAVGDYTCADDGRMPSSHLTKQELVESARQRDCHQRRRLDGLTIFHSTQAMKNVSHAHHAGRAMSLFIFFFFYYSADTDKAPHVVLPERLFLRVFPTRFQAE